MNIMVLAGEPSGDDLAARLVREMCHLPCPGGFRPRFFGLGGPRMARAGVELLEDMTRLAVFGPLGAVKGLLRFRRIFHDALGEAERRQPAGVVLVDYGGFNLRFARALRIRCLAHRREFSNWDPHLVYYVPPQVWASREGRARTLAATVDRVISILPFEKDWYAARYPDLHVVHTGDPLADILAPYLPRRDAGPREVLRIALLPGSRPQEIRRHLPLMLEALANIEKQRKCRAALVTPRKELLAEFDGSIPERVAVSSGNTAGVLAESCLALASSGAVIRECAWLGVPTVVLYRLPWIDFQIARRLIKVSHIAMPNILAGKAVYPELIQKDVTAGAVARAAMDLIRPERYRRVQGELARIRSALGTRGASRRAARAVLSCLGGAG